MKQNKGVPTIYDVGFVGNIREGMLKEHLVANTVFKINK